MSDISQEKMYCIINPSPDIGQSYLGFMNGFFVEGCLYEDGRYQFLLFFEKAIAIYWIEKVRKAQIIKMLSGDKIPQIPESFIEYSEHWIPVKRLFCRGKSRPAYDCLAGFEIRVIVAGEESSPDDALKELFDFLELV